MSVYDDEKIYQGGQNDESDAESSALTPDELKDKEASSTDITPSDTDNQEAGLYKGGDAKTKRKGRFSRNQKLAGGGITGLVIAGSFAAFSILQGPLQIIHFSQLLKGFHFSQNEDFGDSRTYRYFRNKIRGGSAPERSRLGVLGNKMADRYELTLQKETGLRSVYHDRTGRLIGYEVIDQKKSIDFLSEQDFDKSAQEIDTSKPVPIDSHSYDTNNNYVSFNKTPSASPFIDLAQESSRTRRLFVKVAVKGTKTNKISSSLAARVLRIRAAADFHPLKNIAKSKEEQLLKYFSDRKKERAERDATGTISAEDTPPREKADENDPEPTADEKAADQAGNEAKRDAKDGKSSGDLEGAKTKIGGKIAGGSVIGFGVLCTVRSISQNVDKLQYANIVLPLIRTGTRIVATGYQVMSGNDVNMDELGSVTNDLYDSKTQSSWSEARSIQVELGQNPTGPDIPAAAKPSRVGTKPTIFDIIDRAFEAAGVAGRAACSGAGQLVMGALTGGWIDTAFSFIKNTLATQAGVPDPVAYLADYITKKLAGAEVDTYAKGAELGNYANYGARLAANDQALAMGGRNLTDSEVAELNAKHQEYLKQDMSNLSFYARVLDIKNVNSVLGRVSMAVPSGPRPMLASVINIPTNIFSKFMPKTHATAQNYSYGFDKIGFSQIELDNPSVSDPFANAEYVEPKIDSLNETYGKCFNVKVTLEDSGPKITYPKETADAYDERNKPENSSRCNNKDDPELLKYRMYIADTTTIRSLACYQEDEESCTQLGFGSQTTTDSTAETTPTTIVAGDTSNLKCEAGTDGGVGDGYQDGKLYKIRLCVVQGITVNAQIAVNVNKLLTAAKATLRISGSGFRTMQGQIDARIRNGCPDIYTSPSSSCRTPTARPGYSNHQMGLAIDFNCDGATIRNTSNSGARMTSPNNACWRWLDANAGQYGLSQLNTEAWHWSVDGR